MKPRLTASGVAVRLKEEIKKRGFTISGVADTAGVPYSTLASWFSGRNWLDMSKPAHREIVLKVCSAIGIDSREVVTDEDQRPSPVPLAGINLLDILLDVIENPTAPQDQKKTAKQTIREWLLEKV